MAIRSILRVSLLAAALGAALSAQAVSIFLASTGTTVEAPVGTYTATETVKTQVGGFGALTNLTLVDDNDFGHGIYSGPGGTFEFDYAYLPGSKVNLGT